MSSKSDKATGKAEQRIGKECSARPTCKSRGQPRKPWGTLSRPLPRGHHEAGYDARHRLSEPRGNLDRHSDVQYPARSLHLLPFCSSQTLSPNTRAGSARKTFRVGLGVDQVRWPLDWVGGYDDWVSASMSSRARCQYSSALPSGLPSLSQSR